MSKRTPQCDRWGEVVEDAKTIEEFLDYLNGKGFTICLSNEYGFFPKMQSNRRLVYDYFEIDSDKLERERRELLLEIQQQTKKGKRSA